MSLGQFRRSLFLPDRAAPGFLHGLDSFALDQDAVPPASQDLQAATDRSPVLTVSRQQKQGNVAIGKCRTGDVAFLSEWHKKNAEPESPAPTTLRPGFGGLQQRADA
jgi:hypothetical protein